LKSGFPAQSAGAVADGNLRNREGVIHFAGRLGDQF
jgi:hypothetical protein